MILTFHVTPVDQIFRQIPTPVLQLARYYLAQNLINQNFSCTILPS